jgi:uncharacterized protein YacL
LNIFKNYRKLGRKEFFRRFKSGVRQIPPQDLIRVQLISLTGQALGLVFAIVMIILLSSFWYISIALSFAVIFVVTQIIAHYQQYKSITTLQEKLKNIQSQQTMTMKKIIDEKVNEEQLQEHESEQEK